MDESIVEIITRKEARELGLMFFSTGRPCKYGHLADRYVSTGICKSCSEANSRDPVAAEKRRNAVARRRLNPDVRSAEAEYKRNRRKDPEVKAKEAEYARSYKVEYLKNGGKEKYNAWRRGRYKSDPVFAMADRIRKALRKTLRGKAKSKRTEEILGCSFEFFKEHIERQFVDGMSWNNRHLWHIDHIIPLSTARTEADVIALNHVSNLRPMWGDENMSKRAKVLFLV